MKRILIILTIIFCISVMGYCDNLTLPESPDDVRVEDIILSFDIDGNLIKCTINGSLLKSGDAIKQGTKNIINNIPASHKAQYETYQTIYENALKTQLGL